MPEGKTWVATVEKIIAKGMPREQADKLAWECAEVADRPRVEYAKPDRPLQTYKDGIKRAINAVYDEDPLAFDEVIRSLDGAKEFLRECGGAADKAESGVNG